MRRFINSLAGRVVSHVVAASLILPTFSLAVAFSATTAKAGASQSVELPEWAVVDFDNRKDKGTKFGEVAAEAISSSLAKNPKYDVKPRDTVVRGVETLGLSQPIPTVTSLLRVGQEIFNRNSRASKTIISGEIVDYVVQKVSGGKLARASMRVVCYDIASGLPINGSATYGVSTVRAGDVSDEVLINDALTQAGEKAVQDIQSRNLPEATVLNTFEQSALINAGTRAGFKRGTQVIITRGQRQVASAEVVEAQPTNSTVRIGRSDLGLQPGDKVRAVFAVPEIGPGFTQSGEAVAKRVRGRNDGSGVLTAILIVALVLMVTSGPGSNTQEVVGQVVAEPVSDPTNGPSINVSWKPNGFAKGNTQRIQWQVYRNDDSQIPVRVVSGNQTNVLDTLIPTATNYYRFQTIGGTTCTFPNSDPNGSGTALALQEGRPYIFEVELIYGLNRIDLPDGGSSGGGLAGGGLAGGTTGGLTGGTTGGLNGGTTGGTTTGGTTTGTTGGLNGGTTGTTTTGTTTTGTTAGTTTGTTSGTTGTVGEDLCLFQSARTASGQATPTAGPQLIAPVQGVLQNVQTFSFTSIVTGAFPFTAEYVLQVSTTPTFARNTVYQRVLFRRNDSGTLASDSIDFTGNEIPAFVKNASVVYYRIGAKNIADRPGPKADSLTQQRYVFSNYVRLTRPTTPPPPPAN